ncbi:hypothetical protein BDF22DRAFT_661674 [Syncephalis plumigaleata]|nr:hypothetical protein BDF22DRAFT_661674 [Syncephalis plumigaleata]
MSTQQVNRDPPPAYTTNLLRKDSLPKPPPLYPPPTYPPPQAPSANTAKPLRYGLSNNGTGKKEQHQLQQPIDLHDVMMQSSLKINSKWDAPRFGSIASLSTIKSSNPATRSGVSHSMQQRSIFSQLEMSPTMAKESPPTYDYSITVDAHDGNEKSEPLADSELMHTMMQNDETSYTYMDISQIPERKKPQFSIAASSVDGMQHDSASAYRMPTVDPRIRAYKALIGERISHSMSANSSGLPFLNTSDTEGTMNSDLFWKSFDNDPTFSKKARESSQLDEHTQQDENMLRTPETPVPNASFMVFNDNIERNGDPSLFNGNSTMLSNITITSPTRTIAMESMLSSPVSEKASPISDTHAKAQDRNDVYSSYLVNDACPLSMVDFANEKVSAARWDVSSIREEPEPVSTTSLRKSNTADTTAEKNKKMGTIVKSGSMKWRKNSESKIEANNPIDRKPSNSKQLMNFFRTGSRRSRGNDMDTANLSPTSNVQTNYWPDCASDSLSVFNHRDDESLIDALIDRKLHMRDGEDVKAIFVVDSKSSTSEANRSMEKPNPRVSPQVKVQTKPKKAAKRPVMGADGEFPMLAFATEYADYMGTIDAISKDNRIIEQHMKLKNPEKYPLDAAIRRVARIKSFNNTVTPLNRKASVVSFAQMRKEYLTRSNETSINVNNYNSYDDVDDVDENTELVYSYKRERASTYTYGDVASVLYNYHTEWRGEEEEESRRAANNIIQCVRKNLQALTLLRDAFAAPIHKKLTQPMASKVSRLEQQTTTIFSCAMKLIPFHKFFLRDAEQALGLHDETGTLKGLMTAVQCHMPGFQYYLHYLSEYPRIASTLEHLTRDNSVFRRLLEQCSENAGQVNIRALLSGPKEHIVLYHSLLQKFIELYAPDDPEYQAFHECFTKFQSICKDATMLIRIGQQKEAVAQIQESLDGLGEFLVTESRRLVYQGTLTRIIMPAGNTKQQKKDGRRNYKGRIYLHGVKIRAIAHSKYPNTFVIIDNARKEFYFQAETDGFCRRWIHYLREMIRNPFSIATSGMAGPSHLSLPNMPMTSSAYSNDAASRSQLQGPLRIRNGTPSVYSDSTDNQSCYSKYDDEDHDDIGPTDYQDMHDNNDNVNPEDSPIPNAVPVVRQHHLQQQQQHRSILPLTV